MRYIRKESLKVFGLVGFLAAILSLAPHGTVSAAQSASTHYQVNETQFGSGSALNNCSNTYCAKISAGDTTVGSASSTSYTAHFGSTTTNVPLLEVITEGGSQNMGVLDTNLTGTATNSIKVRNYLSNGYVLQIAGAAPNQGTHSLTALTSPTTSHRGAEQFGINFAANTAPAIGSNPVQIPSGSYSFGAATPDYATPDLFKYVDGDVVARSTKSSGETDYTMSMIINVSNVTPGGHYNTSFSAVAVPTY